MQMPTVAFIGLGNIGFPMAGCLVRAGVELIGFDLDKQKVARIVAAGATAAPSASAAAAQADVVVSMVLGGRDARRLYLEDGVIANARPRSLFIDCSTIDVATTSELQSAAESAGHDMVDAPVSGGTLRAAEGTLAITVGGTDAAFRRAEPILRHMASAVHHMGPGGSGVAAKICNNLVLGIQLCGLSEAFALGQRLGLDPKRLFDSMSTSSADSWALRALCPVPGPVATSPANNGYEARGATHLMVKDLGIAQAAAEQTRVPFPMGGAALSLYTMLQNEGHGDLDVCAIFGMFDTEAIQRSASRARSDHADGRGTSG